MVAPRPLDQPERVAQTAKAKRFSAIQNAAVTWSGTPNDPAGHHCPCTYDLVLMLTPRVYVSRLSVYPTLYHNAEKVMRSPSSPRLFAFPPSFHRCQRRCSHRASAERFLKLANAR